MSESVLQTRARLLAEQAAGRGAGTVAAKAQAKLVSEATGAPAPAVVEQEPVQEELLLSHARTFVHQVAGATTIMPDGKKLVFGGRRGLASLGQVSGLGYYVTDIPAEIEWLEGICKFSTSQVTEMVADKVLLKKPDPAIAQSAADAARNTELVFNPKATAAVENLGNTIAKDSAGAVVTQQ